MIIQIKLDSIKVDLITQSAGIFSGENIHANIQSITKKNEGSSLIGDQNQWTRVTQIINDQDLYDFHHHNSD